MMMFFGSFVLIVFFLSPSCSVTKNFGDFERVVCDWGDDLPFLTLPKF